ncbi:transposase [Komagataeibacter rhaeticus DSM 16663]|nr:transposase [Komagataeibacter rhaeticus DSM 16663]
MKQPGFFDVEDRPARLSGLGIQLEALSRTVNSEVLRPDLEKALVCSGGRKGRHF